MRLTLRLGLLCGLAFCVAVVGPVAVAAQDGCEFLYPSGDMNMRTLSGGASITYVGTPHLVCRDGVEIWADSAVAYSAQGMQHFIGSVRFYDRSGEMRAEEARYFSAQGRLQASRDVFITDTVQGFTVENGDLIFLRQTAQRPRAQIDVRMSADGRRPRAILTMQAPEGDSSEVTLDPDSVPVSNTPYIVDGNRILIEGDSYFRANGNVEIERDSLHAFADSAEYDQVEGRILLQGTARVDGPTYDLVGRTITLGMRGNDVDEVVSRRESVLTSEDMRLTAPEIRMYMVGGAMDRLVAVNRAGMPTSRGTPEPEPEPEPEPRPRAISGGFELIGDSLDVMAPAETLDRIFAAGNARSVSSANDSLNVDVLPEIARKDWLEGDTVIVVFLPPDTTMAVRSPSDTGRTRAKIDHIVARSSARSLYRLPSADSAAVAGLDPPAIHYVVGDEITIMMRSGEVDHMNVLGQTHGVHLEPLPVAQAVDSLATDSAVAADTTAARDTMSARPPTPVGGATTDGRSPGPSRTDRQPTPDAAPLIDPRRRL